MVYGYARVSIYGQAMDGNSLEVQINALRNAGAIQIFSIAHSLVHGIQLLEALSNKGVVIDVLNMGIVDDSPTGKLIRNIMLAFSEFERDMIIQRTQEGKAVARQNPNFHDGRPKKFSKLQIDHALELLQTHSYQQIAAMTGISRATIARAKAELKQRDFL